MNLTTVKHVKKRDLVQVITGKNKGKTGKILKIDQKHCRVLIEKINLVKRHTKATGKQPAGIIEKEAPIAASNVLLYCEKCGRGVRTKIQTLENGTKVRQCKKCAQALDK